MIKQILQALYKKLPEISDITFHLTPQLICGFRKRLNQNGEVESKIIITNDFECLIMRDKEINPSYKYITNMMRDANIPVTDVTYMEFIVLHEIQHYNDFIDVTLDEMKSIVNVRYSNYKAETLNMTNEESEVVFRNIPYEKSADDYAISALQRIYSVV